MYNLQPVHHGTIFAWRTTTHMQLQQASATTPWFDSSTLARWGPSNSLLGMFMAVLKAMTLGSCSTVLTRCILLAVGAPGPSPAGAMANSIAVGVTIGFLALQLGSWNHCDWGCCDALHCNSGKDRQGNPTHPYTHTHAVVTLITNVKNAERKRIPVLRYHLTAMKSGNARFGD